MTDSRVYTIANTVPHDSPSAFEAEHTRTLDAQCGRPCDQGGTVVMQDQDKNAGVWTLHNMEKTNGPSAYQLGHTRTLDSKCNAPCRQGGEVVKKGPRVRRLTPLECERLQGFPDGHTDIEWKGKPAPDGPRYAAIGNSMAVPCMAIVGRGITEVERLMGIAGKLSYLSVCSGVEAATLAWEPLGWKPVAFAEIEPFPSAVLAARWPEVPNLGDMTKISKETFDHEFDLLVGGTPCQGFSLAGRREGLEDGRSGLALEFVRILGEYRPRWVVWENVPGAFSINHGDDFGAFINALQDVGYGVCWRVLDASLCGVPQRRRRIFLVGHRGDWRPAAAALLDPEGVHGDFAPGEGKGQANPRPAEESAGGDDCGAAAE